MPLSQKHILGVRQFTQDDINLIYGRVALLTAMKPSKLVKRLRGQTLACVFYEPSTRTSASFIAAMGQLGGNVIPITQGVQFSSVAKGETLEDTIVTLGQYADAIVLRHPETGSVERAAAVSPVPIINAGDGIGEHPTQALLDLYTIQKEVAYPGKHMHVAFVGDLANGRTVHSLAVLLARYPFVRFDLISPEALQLKGPVFDEIKDKVDSVHFVRKGLHEVQSILHAADVVYMTRVQKERFCDGGSYETVKDSCLLTPELVEGMKTSARILHPLPRVNEIPTEIDSDPRAAYFREVRAGLLVRRALLDLILEGGSE